MAEGRRHGRWLKVEGMVDGPLEKAPRRTMSLARQRDVSPASAPAPSRGSRNVPRPKVGSPSGKRTDDVRRGEVMAEAWLSGPVHGIASIFQPAAHALVQARDDAAQHASG